MIKLKSVNKKYIEGQKEHQIFQDADLEIASGEKIVALGSSGSGKSTLLNLISGIDSVDSGQIIINKTDITKLNEEERTEFRKENIGFIFQFFNLIPTLTVEENIFFLLELNNMMTANNKNFALDLLDSVGLKDRLKSFPDKLSGGEQQRIAIVRALAHKPKLIIADEPTGNLDTETAAKVMNLLNKLISENKQSLIMATHDRDLAQFSDKVITIRNKKIEGI